MLALRTVTFFGSMLLPVCCSVVITEENNATKHVGMYLYINFICCIWSGQILDSLVLIAGGKMMVFQWCLARKHLKRLMIQREWKNNENENRWIVKIHFTRICRYSFDPALLCRYILRGYIYIYIYCIQSLNTYL